ncbi:hypothetical protein MCRY_21700 [Marivita cryptomonadis]|nr:hypothetical protein MCRY_21700 [Marivita cryptomonadis]
MCALPYLLLMHYGKQTGFWLQWLYPEMDFGEHKLRKVFATKKSYLHINLMMALALMMSQLPEDLA